MFDLTDEELDSYYNNPNLAEDVLPDVRRMINEIRRQRPVPEGDLTDHELRDLHEFYQIKRILKNSSQMDRIVLRLIVEVSRQRKHKCQIPAAPCG